MTPPTRLLVDGAPPAPVPRFVAGAPHITADDRLAVDAILRSGWLGCGPEVAALEDELASFCAAGEAVVVASATAALALTLAARGIGPGDEVVTSPLTFAATANAIASLGARPVFVDTVEDGSTLDPDQVMAAGPCVAAVIPVAWKGEPTDTATLRGVCNDVASIRDGPVLLLEDGAYALGSRHDDASAASPAAPLVVSFHPTKLITAGLGGALLGADGATARRLRLMRNQGVSVSAHDRPPHEAYNVVDRGFALEMSDVHAALGRSQLRRIHSVVAARRAVFDMLHERLSGTGLGCPSSRRARFGETNASLFAVLLPDGVDRRSLRIALASKGVHTGIHYPLLADQAAWSRERRISDLSHSRRLAARTLTLPTSPVFSAEDCDELACAVVDALREAATSASVGRA